MDSRFPSVFQQKICLPGLPVNLLNHFTSLLNGPANLPNHFTNLPEHPANLTDRPANLFLASIIAKTHFLMDNWMIVWRNGRVVNRPYKTLFPNY